MLHVSPAITIYLMLLTALLGVVMGSFLNCLAWRLTHGESVLHGRSHCAVCNHTLQARDLIPVASWLALRGRCRYCNEKISPRYLAAEAAMAVVYLSILLRYDVSLQALRFVLLASILLVISLVDLETYCIPDRLILAGIVCALLPQEEQLWHMQLLHCLLGSLFIALPLLLLVQLADRILGRESMGGGDIKLLFMVGLYFPWQLNLFLLILACILGLALAMVLGKAKPGTPFPFGPAIAVAAWLVMLIGQPLLVWYLGLF